jgi:hypothetical protein
MKALVWIAAKAALCEEFETFLKAEQAKYAKPIKDAKIPVA